MFKDYLEKNLSNTERLYYNYRGINRKQYPKWSGWKIINSYKEKGIDVKDINDKALDVLVENFYYLKYIGGLE